MSNWTENALRKLDALCAVDVMVYRWAVDECEYPHLNHGRCEKENGVFVFFTPSTQWANAGEVFEKMRDTGRNPLLNWLPEEQKWHASVQITGEMKQVNVGGGFVAMTSECVHALADSPTLAITLAATSACSGKTVEEVEKECGA